MTTPDGAPRHGPYYVASVVALYWVVSISMVFLNKLLMTNGELSIPAPLFVTWWQSVVTAVMCYVGGLVRTGRLGFGSLLICLVIIKGEGGLLCRDAAVWPLGCLQPRLASALCALSSSLLCASAG